MAKGKVDPRIEQRISTLKENAKSHLAKSEHSEALSCLDLAIDLNMSSFKIPVRKCDEMHNSQLYRLRAITHACLGNYRGVAEDANKVIELAPTIMDGYYHKGYALFNLKEYSDAAKAFQQGLRLHPNDKVLRQGFWDSIALVSQSRSRNQDHASITEGELLIA